MSTAIEYGLIAAGISVAIIAVVQGLGPRLKSTFSEPVIVRREPPPPPKFSAALGGWRPVISQEETGVPGFRKLIVDIGRFNSNHVVAMVACEKPQIEQGKANIAWFNSGYGHKGYVVLCN